MMMMMSMQWAATCLCKSKKHQAGACVQHVQGLCATTCAKTSGWRRQPKVASRDLPATHLDNHLGDEDEVDGDG